MSDKPKAKAKPKPAPAPKPVTKPKKGIEKKKPKTTATKLEALMKSPTFVASGFYLAAATNEFVKAANYFKKYLEMQGIKLGQLTDDPKVIAKVSKKLDENLEKAKKKGKLPEVKNPKEAVTKIGEPNENEELVAYMYRSIEGLNPPKTILSIKLLYLHLYAHKNVFQHAIYPKKIVELTIPKKGTPTFRVGDPIFLRTPLAGKYKAGFLKDIKGGYIYFTTIKNGKKVVEKAPANNGFIAFHLEGNKQTVPSYKPAKPEKKKAKS